MKSSEFKGFNEVFKFTLSQTLKQKSFIISFLIFFVGVIAMFPIMSIMQSKGSSEGSIEKAYVVNETPYGKLPFEKAVSEDENLKNVEFVESDKTNDELVKQMEDTKPEDREKAVIINFKFDEEAGSFLFNLSFASESKVDEDDVYILKDLLVKWFEKYKVELVEVEPSMVKDLQRKIETVVTDYDDFVAEDDENPRIITENEYNLVYAALMVFYMIIVLVANMVSTKVVEEKANRIVEYLMTTVRPMALILGKVMAMIVVTVGEVAALVVGGFASNKITTAVMGKIDNEMMNQFISVGGLKNMGVVAVILCIFIMALGIFMYSFLAGLFGASVSKMEELQQGMKNYITIILISFFGAIIAANMLWIVGMNVFVKIIMFFPLTSVMMMPGIILIGKATVLEIIISVVLMLITTLAIFKFVSVVYESVIVMNGNPISFKAMLGIAKQNASVKKMGGASNEK